MKARPAAIHLALSVLSGAMLGFSFPPSEFGILACFGLVPLLIVLHDHRGFKTARRWIYVGMLVFHLITLNWTGGYAHGNDIYMMIAGAVTMLVHPFFYFLPLGAYMYIKKYVGEGFALLSLPFVWLAYEYSHSLSEWSFPWLTIGNSQTYDISAIQFIDFTGVYGLSFWVLTLNVIAFLLYSGWANNRFSGLSLRSAALAGLFLLVFFAPKFHGRKVLANAEGAHTNGNGTITVGIIQPNINPWDKWNRNGFDISQIYIGKTSELLAKHPRLDLVLWPETAIPDFLLLPTRKKLLDSVRHQLDSLKVSVLTGVQHAVYYSDSTTAPPSAKRSSVTGERYDVFNAAAFLRSGETDVPWYGKMKMVPIAERVPYADAFYFMDFLRWGVGIGGWQIGPERVVFQENNTGAKFSSMICYESTYPGFVASFVRDGAEFISIITIDSWWGRMSGAFQHHRYSVLRAIENRRWIARCAVGGISCFIDPFGREYDTTELFTEASIARTIERRIELSWYSKYGDVFAQVCAVLGLAAILFGVYNKFVLIQKKGA